MIYTEKGLSVSVDSITAAYGLQWITSWIKILAEGLEKEIRPTY